MALTPEQRSLRARIGGFALAAKHDPKETTKLARAGFWRWLEQEYGIPEGLPPAEHQRRLEAAKRAHFSKLAMRSAQVRSRRAAS